MSLESKVEGRKTVQVLLAELKACSRNRNLSRGKQVHAAAVECGHDSSIYVASALINMYSKCDSMVEARKVFETISHQDVVSWNVLILGYAENGQGLTALNLFTRMRSGGLAPDSVTFVAAFKACTSLALEEDGWEKCRYWSREIYKLAVENGCDSDIYVQNTLINMYAKGGSMDDARQVFNSMKHPNVVTWTALIMGYAEAGQGLSALDLFMRMRSGGAVPNSVTFVAALKACTSLADFKGRNCKWLEWGKGIHNLVVENCCDSDIRLQSTLIKMYSECGSMVDAHCVFDSMKHPDVVCWTGLILGYAANGQGLNALDLLMIMKIRGPAPDSVTYSGALKACALLGALELGRRIHSEITDLDGVLLNCLVDFYASCGSLVEAQNVFDLHTEVRNNITWSALLAGYCSCGDHESAFGLFEKMQDAGFQPNSVTLLSILACCSHAGLVEKGNDCFQIMSMRHGIIPSIEHYTCMIDAFGRANKLDEAMAFLLHMPCSPDDVTWMTVLSACRKWKNVEIGTLAFQSLANRAAAAYVLMGKIYGSRGMLQEQEMVIMGMSRKGFADSV